MSSNCFHCAEPVPPGSRFVVSYQQQEQPLCCIGCKAVAEAILANGLDEYYKYRTAPAARGEDLVPEELRQLSVLDDEQLQQQFVSRQGTEQQVTLCLDGISCAACAWLIEHQLERHPAVSSIQVNTTTERARLSWDPERAELSELLQAFREIGYRALPFQADSQEALYQAQSRSMIRRLGLVGLATMQIMMIAIGLYFGVFQDIEPVYRDYLRGISWLLATPVVLYGAKPFFVASWHSLRAGRLVMDVPVSLAIGGAYLASSWATWHGSGEVYFESISMFTFFLLIGRFLEMRARRRAIETSSNLLKQLPVSALRWQPGSDADTATRTEPDWQPVAAIRLQPGDKVLVRPGELVPADGVVIDGTSSLDESMLTGEHTPQQRSCGDAVFAGTVNAESPLQIRIVSSVDESRISALLQLQEQALSEKPVSAELADRLARWFTLVLLLVAGATALFWSQHRPEDAFWITLAVLVATCPCALSLATPAALTCATASLSRRGIMLRSGQALERFPSVSRVVFDKTGTLTEGRLQCRITENFSPLSHDALHRLASALESFSEHPIAHAFQRDDLNDQPGQAGFIFDQVEAEPGQGLSGRCDNQYYRIGRWDYLGLSADKPAPPADSSGLMPVYLAGEDQLLACFWLDDTLRAGAEQTVAELSDWQPTLLTGDPSARGPLLAEELNMTLGGQGVTPEQKLDWIRQAQQRGEKLLMVGDGVNDAPVLAAASLSVAMGDGTDLAKNSADVLLLANDPTHLLLLRDMASQTQRVIRQNMMWALGYNLLILPLAVSGLVVPWLAALGMSLSSVLVVSNSLRLLR